MNENLWERILVEWNTDEVTKTQTVKKGDLHIIRCLERDISDVMEFKGKSWGHIYKKDFKDAILEYLKEDLSHQDYFSDEELGLICKDLIGKPVIDVKNKTKGYIVSSSQTGLRFLWENGIETGMPASQVKVI